MTVFYFTFGHGHLTIEGKKMKDCYVTVEASDYEKARELFIEHFASKKMPTPLTWAFQYTEDLMQKQYFPEGEYCRIIEGHETEVENLQ